MKYVLAAAVLIVAFAAAVAGGMYARGLRDREATATPPQTTKVLANASRGEVLFQMHCAKCHGEEGRGDAEGMAKMTPPPRDFASRPWKFAPTRKSIAQVIREGSPGTAMPGFATALSAADIQLLTEHVLDLAEPKENTQPADVYQTAGFARLASPRSAPALQLEDSAGATLTLENLRGRWVLLNFWGTNCPHCLARMPELAKLQARFADQPLTVVNICADEDDAATAQAALPTETVAPLTTYVDSSGLASPRYEVTLMPTIWLVDPQGQLHAKAQGARDWNDPKLHALLEILLRPL